MHELELPRKLRRPPIVCGLFASVRPTSGCDQARADLLVTARFLPLLRRSPASLLPIPANPPTWRAEKREESSQ